MITRILRWMLCCILLTALISRDIHRFGLGVVFPWVVVAACFGGLLWLRSRLETRLSRPVYTSLVEAVRAQPLYTPLVDYETGDRLATTRKQYLGLPDGSWVHRIPQEPSGEDAMSDFNLGQPISTIPTPGSWSAPAASRPASTPFPSRHRRNRINRQSRSVDRAHRGGGDCGP